MSLTEDQAQMLVEAFELEALMEDQEECVALIDHNPELYLAYCALMNLAGYTEDTDDTE